MDRITTLFIVDDNLVLLGLYEKYFKLKGFQIIGTANNGDKAVKMFAPFHEKPDIVLMDQNMPIKSGLEAVKEILKIDNQSKIIFISAEKNISSKVLSLGVSFIHKPFTFEKLLKKIKKLILNQEKNNVLKPLS